MTGRLAQNVLQIGWDAVNWKVINPLLGPGANAHPGRPHQPRGDGNLATLPPTLSRRLWNSIATAASGQGTPADLMDPAAAQAVLQQFVALGYMQPPKENQQKAVEAAARERRYNLTRVYLDSRRA